MLNFIDFLEVTKKRNRKIFKDYIQVYIKSSLKILQKRNNKSIYSKKKCGWSRYEISRTF